MHSKEVEAFLRFLGFDPEEMPGRVSVAMGLGYMDARSAVDLMQTYGFPLVMTAIEAGKAGLRMDWGGLEGELYLIGKTRESARETVRGLRREVEQFA